MQGKVEICGVNTSRLKVLSQKEMDSLLRRSRDGDEGARQELIEGNLRLVLSVIQRFSGRGESPDDLFQVGCIGLMKAVSNFDPDKQVRFSTYGVPIAYVFRGTEWRIHMARKNRPSSYWTDEVIREVLGQFIQETGRIPNTKDLGRNGLPAQRIFPIRYGISAGDWLKAAYGPSVPSWEDRKEKYTQMFIEEYNRLQATSGEDYDERRGEGVIRWRALLRYYPVKNWCDLLSILEQPKYYRQKEEEPKTTFTTEIIFV